MRFVLTRIWILAALVVLPSSLVYGAQTVLETQHVDIGLGYEDGEWDLHVHNETDDEEYEPGEALLYAGMGARTNRSASSAFNFIGVGAGQQYWRLPQSNVPGLLYLGVGTEEIAGGTFASWNNTDPRVNNAGPYVILELIDVRGPGEFSVWSSTDDGPLVWMSTYEGGITSDDRLYQLEGSHSHFNYGFTQAGLYEVDFRATAYLGPGATNPVTSDVATYHFGIEAVPEPATWGLLASGGALCALAYRRRWR
ncbi:MAG: choice-of-anchor M domain-containing protein [Planctomycetaceae bacterium]|nr:choice-of-anchor M domain-containing protein [Planctomycetaceae bacterium]